MGTSTKRLALSLLALLLVGDRALAGTENCDWGKQAEFEACIKNRFSEGSSLAELRAYLLQDGFIEAPRAPDEPAYFIKHATLANSGFLGALANYSALVLVWREGDEIVRLEVR
jgi:hypothetical protein